MLVPVVFHIHHVSPCSTEDAVRARHFLDTEAHCKTSTYKKARVFRSLVQIRTNIFISAAWSFTVLPRISAHFFLSFSMQHSISRIDSNSSATMFNAKARSFALAATGALAAPSAIQSGSSSSSSTAAQLGPNISGSNTLHYCSDPADYKLTITDASFNPLPPVPYALQPQISHYCHLANWSPGART